MATIDIWIQLENHPWDVSPNNIDRIMGLTIKELEEHESPGSGHDPVDVTLTSPETGAVRTRRMYKPLRSGVAIIDALILRRYTPNWAAPADQKVNPWDMNEPNPTDNGTMGTIPGPVIECNVGDRVIVHFRNKDFRSGKDVGTRTHSLHTHGFVFANTSDGAYPLSPPDLSQPIGAGPGTEEALWAAVGVSDFKKGDRVPPGATFNYTWQTFDWPTTAGVWLYHDHSICDMDNVQLGAIGIIVIHNPHDPDDVISPPLPGGSVNGSPLRFQCFPFPFEVAVLPHDLNRFALTARPQPGLGHGAAIRAHGAAPAAMKAAKPGKKKEDKHECEHCDLCEHCEDCDHCDHDEEAPILARAMIRGDLLLELNKELTIFSRLCTRRFRTPPDRTQFLQLYHNLTGGGDAGESINGRRYLGNTPTLVAGLSTKMRFGLVGMGNVDGFHTFHLHGHRWVIPGPDGNTPIAIQGSIQNKAVSQFEDTRTFGPANSFSFTINQGSFMGSLRAPAAPGIGEWHMHCHVLTHMMHGMMGSLLIVNGGELFFGLPSGEPCGMAAVLQNTIAVTNFQFTPSALAVSSGTNVIFDFQAGDHTVQTLTTTGAAVPIHINNGGGPLDAVSPLGPRSVMVMGNSGDVINYQCGIHGPPMVGMIQII